MRQINDLIQRLHHKAFAELEQTKGRAFAQGAQNNAYLPSANKRVVLTTPIKSAEKLSFSPAKPFETKNLPELRSQDALRATALPITASPRQTRLVTPFFKDGDLSQLDPKSLTLTQFREIAGQLALGLAAWHQECIVHRDFKLANIFVERDGDFISVRIGDNNERTRVDKNGKLIPRKVKGEQHNSFLPGSDLEYDISYNISSLPPVIRELAISLRDLEAEEQKCGDQVPEGDEGGLQASSPPDTNNDDTDDNTRRIGSIGNDDNQAAFIRDEELEGARRKLLIQFRDANNFRLETYAYYLVLYHLAPEQKPEELGSLLTKLACCMSGKITMEGVVNHRFFGANAKEREKFFSSLRSKMDAANKKIPSSPLPEAVSAIVEAAKKIMPFKGSKKSPALVALRAQVEGLSDQHAKFAPELNEILNIVRHSRAFGAPVNQAVHKNLLPELQESDDQSALVKSLKKYVEFEIERLQQSADNLGSNCFYSLFKTTKHYAEKCSIISATLEAVLTNSGGEGKNPSVYSLLTKKVHCQLEDKSIEISLAEALCLSRKNAQGRWINASGESDYSIHGFERSFNNVMRGLRADFVLNQFTLEQIKEDLQSRKKKDDCSVARLG